MSLFWWSWCRFYGFLRCWVDFRRFQYDWMSRSRDSGKGHGHFRQILIMFIFLHALFFTQLPIDMVKQLSVLIGLKTLLIIPAHRRSNWFGYGHLQGHRMCHFRLLSVLTSVDVMNIYSVGWIQSWGTVDQFILH